MTIKNITFFNQFFPDGIFTISDPYIDILYFSDSVEIANFLFDNLDKDKVYVLTLEFVYSWDRYSEDLPVISLSKPILATRESNPKVIADFIQSRISLCYSTYYLEDRIINSPEGKCEAPGVIVKYKEIRLF